MQLMYVGFEQARNVREYTFHGIARGEETRVFVVSTDMALFLEWHLGIQEGPMMCLRALAAKLEALDPSQSPPLRHTINEQDVRTYLSSARLSGGKKAGNKRPPIQGAAILR
jgi:hypothetical protein